MRNYSYSRIKEIGKTENKVLSIVGTVAVQQPLKKPTAYMIRM